MKLGFFKPEKGVALLAKKGKALMNDLDPDPKLKALSNLKVFVDTGHARINRE